MESLYWSNNQHHPLEGNSLFMPLISGGNDILCNIGNNIGGNIFISKDQLNPIKADDQQHIQKTGTFFKDAAPAMSLHHHHHHPSYYQQNGRSPLLDSRATSLYNPGLEPGIVASAGSFGSLDGLLSASNSLTETTTSIEDDGISMIFSDCKSLLMSSSHKGEGKHMETDSRNSSQEHILVRSADKPRSDPINPNKRKRSSEDLQIKSTVASKNSSFQHISSDHQNQKKPRKQKSLPEKAPIIPSSSSNINFQQPSSSASSGDHEPDTEAIAQMKEMIYRAAAFRPVDFGVEITEKPKRKNVKISNYPQTVAARQRRERISERIRVLQRLVPGGNKMDTASMLDEAANYLKFLRSWVKALESFGHKMDHHHHQSMINSFSAASSSSAMNGADLNNLGFSVPFMNHSFTMQPQFSFLNPSSVHPSRS